MTSAIILPTNPRSATYAAAKWVFDNGPAPVSKIVEALIGKFSERTLTAALNEMTRVGMAFERLPDQALQLRPHVHKFFFGIEGDDQDDEPPVVGQPFRRDWRQGSLSPQYRPRRPMREGAEDYKRIPSHYAKGGAQ